VKHGHYRESEPIPVTEAGAQGITLRWAIGEKDGAENFFMRIIDFGPGSVSPNHSHSYEHEMFVIDGKGSVELEGEKRELNKGDVLFVPPDSHHCFESEAGMEMMCLIPKQ
jgi:quercetin dioxygenase-like cupin family protein